MVEWLRAYESAAPPAPVLATVQQQLDELNPAAIASIVESLPLDERVALWQLVMADCDGEIRLEVSDALRDSLIADMDRP